MKNYSEKHGYWIHWYRELNDSGTKTNDYSRCSVCYEDQKGFVYHHRCPECGAIMDLKK